jgi:hypothetical protein
VCIRSIIQSDPALEVRRAAVLVISLLLQGIGHENLKVCSVKFPFCLMVRFTMLPGPQTTAAGDRMIDE